MGLKEIEKWIQRNAKSVKIDNKIVYYNANNLVKKLAEALIFAAKELELTNSFAEFRLNEILAILNET